MKKILLFLFIYTLSCTVSWAQTSITIDGRTISGSEADEDIWLFQDEQDTLITLKFEEYQALNRRIEELLLTEERLEKIIEAKDELIDAFENYETRADEHIRTQSDLIETADSLYTGYKDLYEDLKSIYGIQTFSLVVGTGAYNFDQSDWHALFSVGAAYKRYEGTVDIGLDRSYFGLNLRYSIPVF